MGGLFDDEPEQLAPAGRVGAGKARFREPVRDEVVLDVLALDGLIDAGHPARLIWAYVERLDFAEFEARVKAATVHFRAPRQFERGASLWLPSRVTGSSRPSCRYRRRRAWTR